MSKEEPAFPTAIQNSSVDSLQGGLTKREWFAGMAMQIILKHGTEAFPKYSDCAEECFRHADAMIEASKQK